ncbi:LPXTG-motif cell wall-anchored protein [Allocatelliglobosispora scoriae]|uniref:LPXTG-motif cell wall-anchored protein n=1 Tax=Allocatelliglobosispora scoriae TaxID=643052 RepID=A0A841BSY0_9ACTN|nr:LPXTG cell wall anchor domain-containing protein [Allocatelliglobosispora scoriae]MBB5869911.1 LPXTG-motif cell wall-anchored protein [Allocatelliglobosispora scoriae]
MTRTILRVLFAAAVLVITLPSPASAATVGSLYVDPFDGVDTSRNNVVTSGPCPGGTNIITRMFGKGFPAAGQTVQINSPITQYSKTSSGGLIVPLLDTFQSFAGRQNPPVRLTGEYELRVSCVQRLLPGTSLGDFSGRVRFGSPTAYTFLGVRPSLPPTPDPTATDDGAAALPEVPVAPAASGDPKQAAGAAISTANVWIIVIGVTALVALLGGVVLYRRKPGGLTFD